MSIPWSGSTIVQVENLFGVEQVVEFPENSMGEKSNNREGKLYCRSHLGTNTFAPIGGA